MAENNPQLLQLIADVSNRHNSKVNEMHTVVAHLHTVNDEIKFLDHMRKELLKQAGLKESDLHAIVIELGELGHKPGDAAQAAATVEEKNGIKLRSGLITVFDKDGNRHFATPEDYRDGKCPLSDYTPEAIVVRRKNDGEWMEISLVNMSCKNPETGIASNDSEWRMPFGGYGEHVDGLTKYGESDRAQILVNRSGNASGSSNYGYVASSKFADGDGDKSTEDAGKRYYFDDEDHYLPLSRLADGKPNPLFGKGEEKPSFLADGVNFEDNMKAILEKATYQADWRTAAEITCNAEKGNYPAAECCARFKTAHYDDWGLPTAEDWAIAFEDFAEVQEGLKAVQAINPNLAVPLHYDHLYLSSSEYGSYDVYSVYTSSGYMFYISKDLPRLVRAFRLLRI